MGIQPTASKTGLILQCPRPFSEDTEVEPRDPEEPARYGSAIHEVHKKVWLGTFKAGDASELVDKYRLTKTPPADLERHGVTSQSFVAKWLRNKGYTKVVSVETPHKIHLVAGKVSDAKLDEESHTYDLEPGEVGGTDDVTLDHRTRKDDRITVDAKTGVWGFEDFTNPPTPQLRTLGLLTGATRVAIFHCPAGTIPAVYEAPYSTDDANLHLKNLRKAFGLFDTGLLRPGPECQYCPARTSCPAKVGEILIETTALVKKVYGASSQELLPPEVDRPKFLELSRKLEKLFDAARAEIKEEVRAGALYETHDGKTYQIVPASRETVSKKSILAALGPTKGQQEIDRLHLLGCFKTSEFEELRAR